MADDKQRISKQDLRSFIEGELLKTIKVHRLSRASSDESYVEPAGPPTDEEIDDFILSNPMYENELAAELVEPGLLGYGFQTAIVTEAAIAEFLEQTRGWVGSREWLAADLIPYHQYVSAEPLQSKLWLPQQEARPSWLRPTPSALILAAELLHNGRLLSELSWRSFEKLMAEMLEREGWQVDLTRGSKDGGVDIYASREDAMIGKLRVVWQAKKYRESNKVKLSDVRELSGILERSSATKAILVTTSHLTRGALEWVRQDSYRLSYKDREQIEEWIRKHV